MTGILSQRLVNTCCNGFENGVHIAPLQQQSVFRFVVSFCPALAVISFNFLLLSTELS